MSRVSMGLDCGAICEGGECDLQGDHGGNMHSGLIEGARVWWGMDGKLVNFDRWTPKRLHDDAVKAARADK